MRQGQILALGGGTQVPTRATIHTLECNVSVMLSSGARPAGRAKKIVEIDFGQALILRLILGLRFTGLIFCDHQQIECDLQD
jgi:hypothetical protein